MYAWGFLELPNVKHGMELFKTDLALSQAGQLDLELVDLLVGSTGSAGDDRNGSRDFFRGLARTNPNQLPGAHRFSVPLQVKGTGRVYEDDMDMILPHELFACFFHFYKEAFFRFVVPAVDVVERFWKSVAGDAVSFCVCGLIRSFALEMLTLSYTIQSLLF